MEEGLLAVLSQELSVQEKSREQLYSDESPIIKNSGRKTLLRDLANFRIDDIRSFSESLNQESENEELIKERF